MLHWKVEPEMLELKLKLAEAEFDGLEAAP